MERANQLIRETEGVLNRYKIFHRSYSPQEYSEHKIKFQIAIYSLLNRILNILQSGNFNKLTELPILNNLINQLISIYFDRLQIDGYNDESWHTLLISANSQQYPKINLDLLLNKKIEFKIEYFDYGFTFFEPRAFNEELVNRLTNELIEDFNPPLEAKEKSFKKNSTRNNTWFEVGLEFANNRIYELLKQQVSHENIAKEIFVSPRIKIDSYRVWISCSLGNTNHENKMHSIFLRPNAETELNLVVDYCNENNINISEKFLNECKKNNIAINNS